MQVSDERLIELISTLPESDEREAMAVELRTLRALRAELSQPSEGVDLGTYFYVAWHYTHGHWPTLDDLKRVIRNDAPHRAKEGGA